MARQLVLTHFDGVGERVYFWGPQQIEESAPRGGRVVERHASDADMEKLLDLIDVAKGSFRELEKIINAVYFRACSLKNHWSIGTAETLASVVRADSGYSREMEPWLAHISRHCTVDGGRLVFCWTEALQAVINWGMDAKRRAAQG
jgi:hypothetical protein